MALLFNIVPDSAGSRSPAAASPGRQQYGAFTRSDHQMALEGKQKCPIIHFTLCLL